MERKLRFLRSELEKAGIEVRPAASVEAPDPQSKISVAIGNDSVCVLALQL